jgi:hypothetical protein
LSAGRAALLRGRLHGSMRVSRPRELASAVSDEVVRAILCWVWENGVAMPAGTATAGQEGAGAGMNHASHHARGLASFFTRGRTVQGLF